MRISIYFLQSDSSGVAAEDWIDEDSKAQKRQC